jgi:hypothetical protein
VDIHPQVVYFAERRLQHTMYFLSMIWVSHSTSSNARPPLHLIHESFHPSRALSMSDSHYAYPMPCSKLQNASSSHLHSVLSSMKQ